MVQTIFDILDITWSRIIFGVKPTSGFPKICRKLKTINSVFCEWFTLSKNFSLRSTIDDHFRNLLISELNSFQNYLTFSVSNFPFRPLQSIYIKICGWDVCASVSQWLDVFQVDYLLETIVPVIFDETAKRWEWNSIFVRNVLCYRFLFSSGRLIKPWHIFLNDIEEQVKLVQEISNFVLNFSATISQIWLTMY